MIFILSICVYLRPVYAAIRLCLSGDRNVPVPFSASQARPSIIRLALVSPWPSGVSMMRPFIDPNC